MNATVATTRIVRFSSRLRSYDAKSLARWAGGSVRTAEKWRAGECEPGGAALLAMMAANDRLRADLLTLVEELRQCAPPPSA